MPGRKFAAESRYRYGFNGKENDNEVKGESSQLDYGMRIYDPRLAKFLSVDPLSESYPFYTPYQFAGNKPTKFIDLDGLEEVDPILILQQPKNNGESGIGYTTVRKVYFLVTAGLGALRRDEQVAINKDFINNFLNNEDEPATMNPNNPQKSYYDFTDKEFSAFKRRKKIPPLFIAVNVTFDIDIVVESDLTLEQCARLVEMNPAKFGVILNSIGDEALESINIPESFRTIIQNSNKQFSQSREGQAEAYGSSFSTTTNPGSLDLIIFNTNIRPILPINMRVLHEFGHNAMNYMHEQDFDYNTNGLKGNTPSRMAPTRKDKIDIISKNEPTDIYDKVIFVSDTRS